MAVFDHIPVGKEGLKEVYTWLDNWVAEHQTIARKEIIGKSLDGWDIPAIFVTDADIPDDQKQFAVATLARHGQEFGARVVGPEIIRYLCNDEAKEIREPGGYCHSSRKSGWICHG
jgi:hypothetical protein